MEVDAIEVLKCMDITRTILVVGVAATPTAQGLIKKEFMTELVIIQDAEATADELYNRNEFS